MRLLCAWCEKEGKPALIAEVEPREDPTPTHGMCPAHRAEAEKELEALRQKVDEDARRAAAAARQAEEDARRAAARAKEVQALKDQVDP